MTETNPAMIEGMERRSRTIVHLGGLGIPVHPGLPWIETTLDAVLPSAIEVARRALCAMSLAAMAASGGNPGIGNQLVDEFSCRDWLTPGEREFLAAPEGEGDLVTFSWRWEGVAVLFWALQHTDLPWPNGEAKVDRLLALAKELRSPDAIGGNGLRPLPEILDAADLYYRLHWAVRDNALRGLPIPADLNASVVVERDRGLRWLIAEYSRDWDEIDLST